MSGDRAISWFRYVPIADIPAYLAIGWEWNPAAWPLHAPHGFYSVLMTWVGDGEPVEPRIRDDEARAAAGGSA